jgi:hypothetical protein
MAAHFQYFNVPDDAIIVRLYRDKLSVRKIAERYPGLTKDYVGTRSRENGVTMRSTGARANLVEPATPEMVEDYKRGMSIRAIARKNDTPYTSTRKRLLLAGVASHADGYSPPLETHSP